MRRISPLNTPKVHLIDYQDSQKLQSRQDVLTDTSSQASEDSSECTIYDMVHGLKFTFPSNIFFLIGSICNVITSAWDKEWSTSPYYQHYYNHNSTDSYYNSTPGAQDQSFLDDDDGNTDDSTNGIDYYYTLLTMAGSILFILNAMVDISQSIYNQRIKYGLSFRSMTHRDIYPPLTSALLFGAGASIDFWASVKNKKDGVFLFSSHLYLISAIMTMLKEDWQCCESERKIPVTLVVWGDLLFFVGSFMDVFFGFIGDPDFFHLNPVFVAEMGLLSSLLWLIDSILYLMSDFWIMSQCRGLAMEWDEESENEEREEIGTHDLRLDIDHVDSTEEPSVYFV